MNTGSNKKRYITRIGVGMLLVVSVAGLALYLNQPEQSPSTPSSEQQDQQEERIFSDEFLADYRPDQEKQAQAEKTEPLRYRFQPGDELQYDLRQVSVYRYGVQGNVEGLSQAKQQMMQNKTVNMRVEVTGELIMRVYRQEKGEYVVGYQLENQSLHMGITNRKQATKNEEAIQRIEEGLGREVFVELTDRGEVNRMYFPELPEETPGMLNVRTFYKNLLSRSQFVFGENKEEWEVEEQAPMGKTLARYRVRDRYRENGGNGNLLLRIRKERSLLELASMEASSNDGKRMQNRTAEIDGGFDGLYARDRGYLLEVTGGEDVRMSFEEAMYSLNTTGQTELTFQEEAGFTVPGDLAEQLAGRDATTSFSIQQTPQVQRPEQAHVDKSFQEILDKLDELTRQGSWRTESGPFFRALMEKFRRNPELIDRAVAQIKQDQVTINTKGTLISALAQSGVRKGQQALVDMVNESDLSRGIKKKSIFILGVARNPSQEVSSFINDRITAQDTSYQQKAALVAAGNLTKKLEESGRGERKEQILDTLLEQSPEGKSASWKLSYITALGNAGSKRGVSKIKPFLNVDDQGLQTTAYRALAKIGEDRATGLLLDEFNSEQDNFLRKSVLRQLGEVRDERVTAEMKEILRKESRPDVEVLALKYFDRNRQEAEEAKELIQTLAEDGSHPKVRSTAKNILNKRR